MHEQLIGGGARSDFYDEWGMDEHAVAYQYGINNNGGGGATHDADDDYQKIIEESIRANGARNLEDEQLKRILEESKRLY